MVTIEIITIGDELNRGEIIDTNSSWLAERLTAHGAQVRWRTSVLDDPVDMLDALRRALERADLVVSTGGLGPTEDDRTVDVVATLLGQAPAQEPAHEAKLRARLAARGRPVTANNLRQARIVAGAEVVPNPTGMAPGFAVKRGAAELVVLPGVPQEMQAMFTAYVAPKVAARVGGRALQRRTFRVTGLGESEVDHALGGLLAGVADTTLHYRIAYPETLVTVVASRADAAEGQALLDRLEAEARARLGHHLYGIDDQSLAELVGERLGAAKATVAVGESCTGGLIGERLTAVPGASRYFLGGIIAYANDVKRDLLGVNEVTLRQHGAVSEATVIEMADGARRRTGATWGLATSGIAGPGGATADKPVGTVCYAATAEGRCEVRRQVWSTDRERVRLQAAQAALHLLLTLL